MKETTAKAVTIHRWLPYWAVLQADIRQTLRGWIYRSWVVISLLSAAGYLLYHVAVEREAGIVSQAADLVSVWLRWSLLGSVTLIIVLTAGCISSERGTMADSVLSRGISRYQYFLGKWHARLVTVLGTFMALGGLTLGTSLFLLHEDLNWVGCLVTLLMVAALLAVVVSCGVTVSALVNSTLVGIAILWLGLYGFVFLISILPRLFGISHGLLVNLPFILRGEYSWPTVSQTLGWSALASFLVALVGMAYFSRRDV
jgi:hypothetical protein